jgi:hypothetical protein
LKALLTKRCAPLKFLACLSTAMPLDGLCKNGHLYF